MSEIKSGAASQHETVRKEVPIRVWPGLVAEMSLSNFLSHKLAVVQHLVVPVRGGRCHGYQVSVAQTFVNTGPVKRAKGRRRGRGGGSKEFVVGSLFWAGASAVDQVVVGGGRGGVG